MDKIRVAIVGCGAIYPLHAETVKNINNLELVCVIDIDEDRAKEAAQRYNCNYCTNYDTALNTFEIDTVHICTPHYLHAPMAINAMEKGKNVLTEKPMAIDVKSAEEMIKASQKYKKHLGVNFQNRYNNTSVKAKEMIDSGTLGKIIGVKGIVTWFRSKDYYIKSDWRGKFATEGGGVLINQAIHTLDIMEWIAGGIKAVKANVDTRVLDGIIEVEDTADATIYFNNGAVGVFYATNTYTTNSSVKIEFHCEKGILSISDRELVLIQDGDRRVIARDSSKEDKYKLYWGISHEELIRKFYSAIRNNTFDYITAQEGIKTLKLIEGIYKSSETRKKIIF